MSLILEALKKSEQERRRERVPDLRTVHQPIAIVSPRRFPWGWLAIGLLVINLNGLAAWWLLREPAAPGSDPAQSNIDVAQPATAVDRNGSAAPAAPDQPSRNEAAANPAVSAQEGPAVGQRLSDPPTSVTAPPPPAADSEPRSIAELPPSVRAVLPAMTFSFHVFSPNRERRSIIINERRLREGEQIGDGWWLEEVTAEGVVVAGAGERVYIPVLSQW